MDYTNFTNDYLIMKYGELIDCENDPRTIYVNVMREEKQVRNEILKRMEKTGRWIVDKKYMECSNCHDVWFFEYNQTDQFNFCPSCGARMEVEE